MAGGRRVVGWRAPAWRLGWRTTSASASGSTLDHRWRGAIVRLNSGAQLEGGGGGVCAGDGGDWRRDVDRWIWRWRIWILEKGDGSEEEN